MRKLKRKYKILFLSVAAVLVLGLAAGIFFIVRAKTAPAEGESAFAAPKGYELMACVPTDAIGMVLCEHYAAGIEEFFEPDDPFRNLYFKELADEKMLVSYHYLGTMVPMLATYAGRGEKNSRVVKEFERKADSLGLKVAFYPAAKSGQKSILLCSSSENLLASADRHIIDQMSILDNEQLRDSLRASPATSQTIIWRNANAANFLPQDLLASRVQRKSLIQFAKRFADWTIMQFQASEAAGKGEYRAYAVSTVHAGTPASWCKILDAQQGAESRVANRLPQGANFVIDIPLSSIDDFILSRRAFLDATGQLADYEKACRTLKKNKGKDPEEWARNMNIKEVVKVSWRGEEVLLVRPESHLVAHSKRGNAYAGFLKTLFGSGFSIADESREMCIGNWIVMGSDKAIEHFVNSDVKAKFHEWPSKNAKAIVIAEDIQIVWTKSGLKFEMYKTY